MIGWLVHKCRPDHPAEKAVLCNWEWREHRLPENKDDLQKQAENRKKPVLKMPFCKSGAFTTFAVQVFI